MSKYIKRYEEQSIYGFNQVKQKDNNVNQNRVLS